MPASACDNASVTAPTRALDEYAEAAELFSALSAPARIAIVHLLTSSSRTVGEMVEALGLSQPLVSQHLRVLRAARLVRGDREGRSVVYTLTDEHVSHVLLDALRHVEEE
jgi:ArsR family transcriptional regulator, zinc-responsive transcriptional repressor